MENKEELLKKISDLRTEIREHYKLVGDSLYLITLELDKYLEWLSKGVREKEISKDEKM